MAKDDGIKRELGISRRDLLRRGAVVGGTLLWATPVIQSLTTPAFAQTPRPCSCCCCTQPTPFGFQCATDSFSFTACQALCATGGGTPKAGSAGFCESNVDCREGVGNVCVCD